MTHDITQVITNNATNGYAITMPSSAILTQYHPHNTTSGPNLRHDVRESVFVSYATCHSNVLRFVLFTLQPMRCIALDIIRPLKISNQFRYILAYTSLIHLPNTWNSFRQRTWRRRKPTDALWRHSCRFGSPWEIMTDCGSQFMNASLDSRHFQACDTIPPYHTKRRKMGSSRERIRKSIATSSLRSL